MKNVFSIFLVLWSILTFSQNVEETTTSSSSDNLIQKRAFNDKLTSKYNGKEFQYKEDTTVKKKTSPKKASPPSLSFFKGFVKFMQLVFPYLLAAIVIFILVKSILGNEKGFWNFKTKKIQAAAILDIEDESSLDNSDYKKLLELAKKQGDYRKATKYYYLILLKTMSEKELISFDKDKTNTEYMFDLKKTELRKQFSYLLYVYDYVWYGEFNIDTVSFSVIENKYQSFLNNL